MERNPKEPTAPLLEGEDYYFENGLMVLAESYLLRRGYCCGNGCRHCPYPEESAGNQSKKVSSSSSRR